MSARGVVAAGHPDTAAAAREILAEGGNAFDAALAAVCASCVAEPVLASLGGGGFLLARQADGEARLYDFFVATPQVRRAEADIDFHPILADFGTELRHGVRRLRREPLFVVTALLILAATIFRRRDLK